MSRPTIAELEQILQNEQEVEIEILPNGEVRAKGKTSPSETGNRKPITIKENLGGEYANTEFELIVWPNGKIHASVRNQPSTNMDPKPITFSEKLGGEY